MSKTSNGFELGIEPDQHVHENYILISSLFPANSGNRIWKFEFEIGEQWDVNSKLVTAIARTYIIVRTISRKRV